jgi:hypothetical protein
MVEEEKEAWVAERQVELEKQRRKELAKEAADNEWLLNARR